MFNRLLRKMRKSKLETDIAAYKQKRNQVNILLRKAKTNYLQNLLDENFRSPDRFWKEIKRIYPTKNKQSVPTKSFIVNSNLLQIIPSSLMVLLTTTLTSFLN